jgi:hypothetical protein
LKPSKATSSPRITKKQPKTKSVPAKGLEDEDDSDLELENEVDEENALAELEQQQSHLQGVNEEEEEDVRPHHLKLIIGTSRRIRIRFLFRLGRRSCIEFATCAQENKPRKESG